MPLLFFIDKDMLDDPACRDVEDVVLSYTFFRSVNFVPSLPSTHFFFLIRARRNHRGHLEPDASEDVVQESLGFGGYERAPKPEDKEKVARAND